LEMNHSARFWKHVAAVLPEYKTSRKWLKDEGPMYLKNMMAGRDL
nr:M48 family metallopeptidase [Lachnospiraceae bacterium]